MRLLTNIKSVTLILGDRRVRLNCHALVLDDQTLLSPQIKRIRGFGTSSDWPVFTLDLKTDSIDFTIEAAASTLQMLPQTGQSDPQPAFRGWILRFADGTELEIIAERPDKDLDVEDFLSFGDLSRALERKVLLYWQGSGIPAIEYRLHETRVRMLAFRSQHGYLSSPKGIPVS